MTPCEIARNGHCHILTQKRTTRAPSLYSEELESKKKRMERSITDRTGLFPVQFWISFLINSILKSGHRARRSSSGGRKHKISIFQSECVPSVNIVLFAHSLPFFGRKMAAVSFPAFSRHTSLSICRKTEMKCEEKEKMKPCMPIFRWWWWSFAFFAGDEARGKKTGGTCAGKVSETRHEKSGTEKNRRN